MLPVYNKVTQILCEQPNVSSDMHRLLRRQPVSLEELLLVACNWTERNFDDNKQKKEKGCAASCRTSKHFTQSQVSECKPQQKSAANFNCVSG